LGIEQNKLGNYYLFPIFTALDSYGKPASGLVQGNIKWMGSYDECTSLPPLNGHFMFFGANLTVAMDPQYCQVLLKVPGRCARIHFR
jgi:hypothetical protein